VPATVSAIREHHRRKGRFVIEVDGSEAAVVPVDTISQLGLHTGVELGTSVLRQLEVANRRTELLDRALNILAAHARSRRDMRIRLRRIGALDGDVEWVLERLAGQGYLDDADYARQLARARIVGGGTSRRRVEQELFKRGVSKETATDAINATLAEVELDEHGAALNAARKRMRSLAALDPLTRRRRLYSFLARRGYESEVVARVVNEVLSESR
jgi:regulatory protein